MLNFNLKKSKSVFALSMVVMLASCGLVNKQEAQPIPVPSFSTVAIEKGDVVVKTDFPAEIISANDVEVRSRVTGHVTRLYVKEGSEVRKGQAILKIDDRDYVQRVMAAEAAVENCNSQVNNAKLEVEKLRPLVERNIVSKFQLETATINLSSARAGLEQARAQLNDAKVALSYTVVTSPITGIMGATTCYEGNLVSAGGLVTLVAKKGDVFANFAFDEKKFIELSKLVAGKNASDIISETPEVEFVLADGSVYNYKGKLEIASGVVNNNTGSINVRAVLPNPENLLRSGSSGVVRFPQEYKDVVLVPQRSTFELQDKKLVYVYNAADSTISAKKIDVQSEADGYYTVSSGVNAGDVIVYDGIVKAKDGMKIISAPATK